ncbi:MAG: glycosyltransferase [Anaerolineales bacterium]|nr:glycosyltransferase [Anaerolineales bacterium]
MRIGMMLDVYKPQISGVINHVSLTKHYLEKAGHEVFVFTFGDEDHQDDEPNVIRSPGLPLLDTGYYVSMRYTRQARNLLRSMDLVHVHQPFLSGYLALRYCKARGTPIVFTNHTRYDLYSQAYLPVMPDVIGETALQIYLPAFCHSCDMVITPSQGMRDVLLRFGVEVPIQVAPNGIDLEPFRRPVEPLERRRFGFNPDDVVLVYVGRLGPEKNLRFLLRSFSGAYQAYDNVALLIVGNGPEREDLEEQVRHMGVASRVHFAGSVPYENVARYLAMADAFVTASVTEVHPLTVIEAMAAGLPTLGINSPGIGDIIQDTVTGYLVAEEDLASFTAKMVRMVIDHERRREMGKNARQAAENYAIERTTQTLLDLYQQVISQTAGRQRALRIRLTRWMERIGLRQ